MRLISLVLLMMISASLYADSNTVSVRVRNNSTYDLRFSDGEHSYRVNAGRASTLYLNKNSFLQPKIIGKKLSLSRSVTCLIVLERDIILDYQNNEYGTVTGNLTHLQQPILVQ